MNIKSLIFASLSLSASISCLASERLCSERLNAYGQRVCIIVDNLGNVTRQYETIKRTEFGENPRHEPIMDPSDPISKCMKMAEYYIVSNCGIRNNKTTLN